MEGGVEEASDASLVIGVARFDQNALAEVYRRHAGAVLALARRLLTDATLAEEVVQEVFLRLWDAPEKFDAGRGTLRSYLLAQGHGRAVDLLRAEGSRRRREERDARNRPEEVDDIERDALDLVEADRVKGALAELPAEERRAIELAYFGGHTYREVAVLLGHPEGTVKSRIRAGLRHLREHLTNAGISGAWMEA